MNFLNSINIRTAPFVTSMLLMLLIPAGVGVLVQYDYVRELEDVSTERLNLYESTLKSELKKFEYLPYLISETSTVAKVLNEGGDPHIVSLFLEKANTIAGSSVLYVLNTDGIVIAASNWRQKKNFLGLELRFRPYFKDALDGKAGKFYGVGVTAGKPGYYISHPIRSNDKVVGVAVAKIVLTPLENIWQEGGETLFVADLHGVIVLASRPEWKYRTLAPLSKDTINKINEMEQYPEFKLRPLASKSTSRLALAQEVSIGKENFIKNSRSIPGMDWTITYLMPQGPLWERTLGVSMTTFILIGLAVLTRLFFHERQQRQLSRLQAIEASHIRDINKKLAQEIEEHKRTEHELRAAQEELNQPIAAVKTYIASCRLMLKRNDLEKLDPTLQKVSDLGDRMGTVTGQLKSFARKSSNKKSEFDLRMAIQESLTLMKHQFHVENCDLELHMADDPVTVIGDIVRLEQVLINLFRNALDALQDTKDPVIGVSLKKVKERAKIHVWDNGPGIADSVAKRIFEPFVTTKKEGLGVGLGLSISYKIIKDMNGDFRAANREDRGAEFFVHIPLAKKKENG